METMPWLTVLMAIPAVGALVVALLPSSLGFASRAFGLLLSVVTFAVAVYMALEFVVADADQVQFLEQHEWIPQLGASYAVGVNGIGLVMICLATVLTPLCLLAMWNVVPTDAKHAGRRIKNFTVLALALEAMMIGVFAAQDVFLFYIFFEAMLIPTYFLIANFGGPKAGPAAVKFLLYSLAGGLVMLVAVIALYIEGPGGSEGFLTSNLIDAEFSQTTERLMFLAFFFAFAVKAPMWPLHTWLPDAAEQAPPGVSVLLVGVLDKVGTFGMMTLCLVLFPEASQWAAPFIIVLALVSMILGGFAAIGSKDIYRLIAYTSVSHFGLIVLGIFAFTTTSQSGSMLYMVNHGFSTAALFLVAGMLVARRGSQRIADFGGWQRVTPWLAGSFLLAGLSSIALPGMSSFVSEFLVLTGTFQRHPWAGIVGCLGIILSAMYILIAYKRMMTGTKPEIHHHDIVARETVVVAPLIAVILALGFFPAPVLDVINPAVEATMSLVDMDDPTVVADGVNHE